MTARGRGRAPERDRPAVAARRRPRRRHRLRTLVGGSGLLVHRRARQDSLLLLLSWALLTLTALVAVVAPRQVDAALDAGAQEAVRTIGTSGDLVLTADSYEADVFLRDAARIEADLPGPLAVATDEAIVTLLAGPVPVIERDGVAVAADDDVSVAPALLSPAAAAGTTLVAGSLPEDLVTPGDPFPVAVPQTWAAAAGLEVGDDLRLLSMFEAYDPAQAETLGEVHVEVTGIVTAQDPDGRRWLDAPSLWEPEPDLRTDPVPLLGGPEVTTALTQMAGVGSTGTLRLPAAPDAYTADVAVAVADQIDLLRGNPAALGVTPTTFALLPSGLADALDRYELGARAARAQMATGLAGVVGTAGLVLVLSSRLLVSRRAAHLALERARGASVASVVLRASVEALGITVLAVGTALAVATALRGWSVRGVTLDATVLVPVVAVGLLAGPVQTALLARSQWTATRAPANPRDRKRLARRVAARRITREAGLLVLAGAAVLALRDRGLLQTTTGGTDPFLAAAPVLLGAAVTLVAVRLQPWPVRVVAGLGRRTRGVLGIVGAARARRAVAVLPLLALTLGVGVAVSSALLLDTIRSGQVVASWERVGAPARVDLTALPRSQAAAVPAAVAEASGVTSVATAAVSETATFEVGARDLTVSVLAVDPAYAAGLAEVPDAGADLASLEGLASTPASSGVVPVVVDEALARELTGDEELLLTFRGQRHPVEIVGTTDHAPLGQFAGPFAYVDAATIAPFLDDQLSIDVLWAYGPGAAAAVQHLPDDAATVRAQWLADRQGQGFVGGVETVMAGALAVTLLLSAAGLMVTVVTGARERGTTLALLRTLGMRPRLGWWLAAAELVPVVATAVLAGAGSGVLVVLLLGPALGLQAMTGGVGAPALTIAPEAVLGIVGAAVVLVVLAVLVEVLAHRRAGLHEVLRVGG